MCHRAGPLLTAGRDLGGAIITPAYITSKCVACRYTGYSCASARGGNSEFIRAFAAPCNDMGRTGRRRGLDASRGSVSIGFRNSYGAIKACRCGYALYGRCVLIEVAKANARAIPRSLGAAGYVGNRTPDYAGSNHRSTCMYTMYKRAFKKNILPTFRRGLCKRSTVITIPTRSTAYARRN